MKRTIFTIRVVYKSGYTHDFDVYSFKVSGGNYQWEHVDDDNKPIILGADEVAALWQVGHREEVAA